MPEIRETQGYRCKEEDGRGPEDRNGDYGKELSTDYTKIEKSSLMANKLDT